MTHRALALAALVLVAAPSAAAVRTCNNALVTQGVCRVSTNRLLSYDLPPAASSEMATAICEVKGYDATILCDAESVADGECSAGELGQTVSNDLSCPQWADVWVRKQLRDIRRQWRHQQEGAAARATVEAEPPLDIE